MHTRVLHEGKAGLCPGTNKRYPDPGFALVFHIGLHKLLLCSSGSANRGRSCLGGEGTSMGTANERSMCLCKITAVTGICRRMVLIEISVIIKTSIKLLKIRQKYQIAH